MIPENTELGKLTMVEYYEYYDYPLMFLARNMIGEYFLACAVEETATEAKFLYAKISKEERRKLKNKEIDYRTAFLNSEMRALVYIKEPEDFVDFIYNIEDSWLPDAGIYLDFITKVNDEN